MATLKGVVHKDDDMGLKELIIGLTVLGVIGILVIVALVTGG
ncbi:MULTISPECIES: hypothetical protein [unclassified Acinetobacter]|nr:MULTISPECIES: hypothetical protein [unclassified Acinetobacter]